jgi:hypothetical protein
MIHRAPLIADTHLNALYYLYSFCVDLTGNLHCGHATLACCVADLSGSTLFGVGLTSLLELGYEVTIHTHTGMGSQQASVH